MENKEIQLTPAEIEMIKVKREKEDLAAKENALKRQAEIEKEIVSKKQEIVKFQSEHKTQRLKAKLFFEELKKIAPDDYFLITTPNSVTFKVDRFKINNEGVRLYDEKKEVFFEEKVNEVNYFIKHDKTGNIVDVVYHSVYGSSYSSRPTSQYWALEFRGKYYKKAKTVHEKIEEELAKKRKEQKEKEAKATAKETVLAKLIELYPGTKIEWGEQYHSNYNGRGYRKSWDRGWTSPYYIVTFENGLKIKFGYYDSGEISRGEITNIHQFDFNTVVEFMKQQTIKKDN